MQSVSENFKNALAMGKELILNIQIDGIEQIITYENILSFKYSANATGEEGFEFGYVSACEIQFALDNLYKEWDGKQFSGKKSTAKMGIMINGTMEWVKLGSYKIYNVTKNDGAINISMMDDMLKLDKKWSKGNLVLPCSMSQLITHMCTKCGVKYSAKNSYLPFRVNSTGTFKGMTCRNILRLCGETMGRFAIINRDGELELKRFRADDKTVYKIEYEDMCEFTPAESVINITGVKMETANKNVESNEYVSSEEDGYFIYITKDNNLFAKKSIESIQTTINNAGKAIAGLEYLPCTLESNMGNPALEVGDTITITTEDKKTHEILVSTLTFTDNFSMQIISAGESVESREQRYQSSTSEVVNNLDNTTNKSNIIILDHKPVAADLTGDNETIFIWYNKDLPLF